MIPGPLRHAILDEAADYLGTIADDLFLNRGTNDIRGGAIQDCSRWLREHAWEKSDGWATKRRWVLIVFCLLVVLPLAVFAATSFGLT
jgi:hypothetical protein